MNKNKKYIVFLVFIFLCLKAKAEYNYSALGIVINNVKDDKNYKIIYEKAFILFNEGKYAESLKKVLPLTEINLEDVLLTIRVNLLVGKILLEESKNKTSFLEKEVNINNKLTSLKYIKKSLNLIHNINLESSDKQTNDLLVAETYFRASQTFSRLKKNDSTKYYYKKLIEIDNFTDDISSFKAKAYSNLGMLCINEGNLNSAEMYTKKAIEIDSLLNNKIGLSAEYINLATIYIHRKKYKIGKELYGKSLDFLKDEKSLDAIKYKELLYDNMAWALYNLKDYTAYEYVTESYAIRDSLEQEKLTKQLTQIKAENDVKKVQEAANEKQNRLERKNWIIGIIGVVVSLLLLFLANLYKLRQRNLSLKLSQNELRQQRKLERLKSQTQVKILNATIDGKETERKQIAEILHDNVSALLSSAHLHLQASQKQFEGAVPLELQKTQQIIVEASQKIRDLSHNLISSVLLKFGLEYAIKDLAKKFSNSSIKINTAIHNVDRYSEQCEIKIFNIIQELVNNILKHSNAENAYIIMEEEDSKLNIIVKDDGKGFENKLDNEKGIGLNHIKARIKMMKGHFLIETALGEGTKVMMNIPVIKKREMVIA